jgi:hypothetical protein
MVKDRGRYISVLNLWPVGFLEGLEGFFGEGGAFGAGGVVLRRWC